MFARIKLKRDTYDNWKTNNPVLLAGELVVEQSDSGVKYKLGDGEKKYNDLDYVLDINKVKDKINEITNNTTIISNSNGGFAAGADSTVDNDGVSIGVNATTYGGVSIGKNASCEYGVAIGSGASSNVPGGIAIGDGAVATNNDNPLECIQIGTGTNKNEYTAQIYDYQLLSDDAKSKSVSDGSKYLKDVGKLSNLNTTDKTDIVSAINELKNSTGSSEDSSIFSKYTIGDTYTGKDGLCEFSIKGKSANVMADSPTDGYVRAYYYMASQMKGKTPELPHTQAIIKVNDEDHIDLGDLHGISASYTYQSVTYKDYDDTRDSYDDTCYIQRVSDAFYPKAEYITEDLVTLGNGGVKFELRIPEKAFGSQIPVKNLPDKFAPTVCPMTRMMSETHTIGMSSYDNYYHQCASFSWHEGDPNASTDIEKSGYYALIFVSSTDGSTKAQLIQKLFYSKWYIRYTLETPIYKYNTGKLYIHTGDIISIETKESNYSPIVEYINTPDNIAARVAGLDPITQNINDLNERIENVKVGETQVGYPDGTTDNYDAFVALIDNNMNTGVNKVIEIPAGTYYISKPIVINQPHTTLKGSGQAIIKCPTGSPAFVISSNYTTIDGFTFWLSKTEDTASAEADNGSHSAIYVDAGIGIYNTKITNCDFQGAYRLSTKDIERSYGIYYAFAENSIYNPNQWGFSYFNIIENCRFYSLYCGLYLPYGSQPAKVWFSFDRGENIYNIQGFSGEPCYNTLGCGYGCICEGSTNFIRFDGQFIGEDHTTPTNPVFETVNGVKKAVSATINNVSVCAVKCSGTMNYIEGFAYDVQRTDKGYLWFTQQSKNNMYSILNFGTLYGSPYGLAFKDTYTVYDDNNTSYELTMRRNHPYITDGSGMNASTFTPLRYQHDLFLNSNGYLAVGEDGTTTESGTPKHFGIQDNALAYLDKWGGHGDIPAVKCYRIVNGVEETENMYDKEPSESNAVITSPSNLFSAYSDSGWGNGLTFQHTPTEENPIYIKLTFNKPMRFERLMIRFNNYIAKNMSIQPITNYTNTLAESNIGILDNNQGQIDITLYHDQNGFGGWKTITGILIIITDALSVGDYNPNKYVGISNIFGLASNYGGTSYLPRGGGKLYGDINMNGNKLIISTITDLPTASSDYEGCIINVNDGSCSTPYICIKNNTEYKWVQFTTGTLIETIANNTTLISNSNGGFAAGNGAKTGYGVAIGKNAINEFIDNESDEHEDGISIGTGATSANKGISIGNNANATTDINTGIAIGNNSKAGQCGTAIGNVAEAGGDKDKYNGNVGGVAIGYSARSEIGVAIGMDANVHYSDDELIDAIQLGTGTNKNEYTAQIYDYQLLSDDATTKSVTDGGKYLKDVGKLSNLNTTDKTDIVSAINELDTNLVGLDNKQDIFEIDKTEPTGKLILNDKTRFILTSYNLTALNVTVPTNVSETYESLLSFHSHLDGITFTDSSTNNIKWCGLDCDSNYKFNPIANSTYEIYVKVVGQNSNGDNIIIARVGGFNG